MIERLNPLNDFLFLKMLGETGDEEELRAFLNAVLRRTGRDQISSVKIIGDTKLTADIIGDKTSILDILAVMDDGTHVNCEIQIKRVSGVERRLMQYWAREYARSLSAGEEYDTIPNVITIVITEFEMVKLPRFHTCFHIREDDSPEYILTDAMEMHIIEMKKFRALKEVDIKGNPLHRWLTFFDKNTSAATLEEVIRMDRAIQRVNERMEFVMQDKEALRLYQKREMAMSDLTSMTKLARSEGRVEGRAEGREEKAIETARNSLKEGLSVAVTAKITGLDENVINKLRADLAN